MNKTRITAEPGQHALTITREFDAPRELVFKAHVDPELYARWFAPRESRTVLDVFEPRACDRYRYHVDGPEIAFSGVFHEVTAPERIISTFEYETLPKSGHAGLSATTFEDLPAGRSRLTVVELYLSGAKTCQVSPV
jgi:uncharacterized protein YndB with AHSA1/START domain